MRDGRWATHRLPLSFDLRPSPFVIRPSPFTCPHPRSHASQRAAERKFNHEREKWIPSWRRRRSGELRLQPFGLARYTEAMLTVLLLASFATQATSAGFEAGELRFAGTFHLHDSRVINLDSASAAIFLQTKMSATVRFEDNRVEDAASLNRPLNLDGQSGASITLYIHDSYLELTTTTNEREALDLVGSGTVAACSGNTFNRNATPSFMRDAGGTWTGEGDYDTIFL
jgi:hypothetical protein